MRTLFSFKHPESTFMKRFIVLACTFLAVSMVSGLQAAHRSSAEEARNFFDKAVVYVEEVGVEKAVAAFNDPNGDYVQGDLYVFALSTDGLYLANGSFPQLAGTPIDGVNNAAGEPIYDIIMSAVDNDEHEGVARYEWLNPQTNQLEDKSAYVSEVQDVVIGVGYYQ